MKNKNEIIYANKQLIKIKKATLAFAFIMAIGLIIALTLGKISIVWQVCGYVILGISFLLFLLFWISIPKVKKHILQLIEDGEK